MDVFLLTQISIFALIVFLSCESGQTILVDVESERIDTSHRYINAQVKFVAINQQRLVDILADDHRRSSWNLGDVLGDEDAFALRSRSRFADPRFVRLFTH